MELDNLFTEKDMKMDLGDLIDKMRPKVEYRREKEFRIQVTVHVYEVNPYDNEFNKTFKQDFALNSKFYRMTKFEIEKVMHAVKDTFMDVLILGLNYIFKELPALLKQKNVDKNKIV